MIRVSSKGGAFYQFLGLHSLLIGMFPFFIPVFLYKQGFSLFDISGFIGISGFGFCVALSVWCWLCQVVEWKTMIWISFLAEIVLLTSVLLLTHLQEYQWFFVLLFALMSGVYGCFYWTTSRALFFEIIGLNNAGKKYGSVQIVAALLLNVGILIGGVLLENYGLIFVYIASVAIAVSSAFFLGLYGQKLRFPEALKRNPPLSLRQVLDFKDAFRSKMIFVVDGVFLFLESYFWVISLFLLAHESFWQLGVIVIVLAGVLSVVFIVIRSVIDRVSKQKLYQTTVVLYMMSWLMRAYVDESMTLLALFIMLLCITFSTLLFRLSFNKRFFDLAKNGVKHNYLFIKSYYSQLVIGIVFSSFFLIGLAVEGNETWLRISYVFAAVAAGSYFFYRPHDESKP